MINKYAIESAYTFFHQKQRIYQYSSIDSQMDDIEYSIDDYTSQMDDELYKFISHGRNDYLRNHACFASDIQDAVKRLEELIKRDR